MGARCDMKWIVRNFKFPESHYFLLGPRGTGKTTMLKQKYRDALYIDLLLPDQFRTYAARPEHLIEIVNGHPEKSVVIVDEIQKVPQLLSAIHYLIEQQDGKQFILTGSSARKLRKQGVNLLGGRAAMFSMNPFSAGELGKKFDFDTALRYGLLPVIYFSRNQTASLDAYVNLYIREEVMMEGLTRNVGNFSRFLEVASFSHGAQLNVSNIARECQIERKVVESYIGILEDLLIASRLRVFSRKAKRQLVRHPKLYFFDTGLFRSLRPVGPLDRPEEIEGAALEGLVFQNLKAVLDQMDTASELSYWRTRNGNEVDFVIYGEKLFTAIEVKNTGTIRPSDLRSLRSFHDEYPQAQRILLYRGKETFLRDEILVMPCRDFLPNVENILMKR